MVTSRTFYTWKGVIAALRKKKPGSVARIPISQITHPLDAKMVPTVAASVGQRADFKRVLDAETLIHVQEFDRHYEAQLFIVITIPDAKPKLRAKPQPAPEPDTNAESDSEQRSVAVGSHASNALLDVARDAPAMTLLGVTALGALLGAALGGKNGAATGAIIGGCAGLAAVGLATAESSPATAQLSKEMFESVVNGIGRQQAARRSSFETAPSLGLAAGNPSSHKTTKRRKRRTIHRG